MPDRAARAGCVVYGVVFPWIVAQRHGHPRLREILLVCAVAGWLVAPRIAALAHPIPFWSIICGLDKASNARQ